MNVKDMSIIDFAALLRRQAAAIYAATDTTVADDLSASLKEAADRLIVMQQREAVALGKAEHFESLAAVSTEERKP